MAGDIVYGQHAVAALLETDPAGVRELWVQADKRDALTARVLGVAETHGIAVHRVARATLGRMLPGARHQGVAARYRPVGGSPLTALSLEELVEGLDDTALLLVLDAVQDPHNLGACLRTAAAAGAQAVVVPRRRAAGLSPGARKAAAGAAEAIPLVVVGNLAEALRKLRAAGVRLVGASPRAERPYHAADLRGRIALVLGGEGQGLRRLTRELCDELLGVPMAGGVESLNVSVAAGVCLFEARRQRDEDRR